MKETSSNQASYTDRIRSWARTHAYGGSKQSADDSGGPELPLSNDPIHSPQHTNKEADRNAQHGGSAAGASGSQEKGHLSDSDHAGISTTPASEAAGTGTVLNPEDGEKKPNIATRFFLVTKKVLLYSWINALLVFVPVGIAVAVVPGMNAGVVFAMNAVAIIPLAGLLSHATESVAHRLGDTLGALLNVSFGNAVELIIL